MRNLLGASLLLVGLFAIGCSTGTHSTSRSTSHQTSELAKGFVDPPDSARPHTWWHWVSGNASKQGITADLEAMHRIGVGGAQMFFVDQVPNQKDRGPVRYMNISNSSSDSATCVVSGQYFSRATLLACSRSAALAV